MKKLNINLGILTAVVLSAFASTTMADTYEVTFTAATSDATFASGQLSLSDGVATDGTLNVVSGPDAGSYTLISGTGGDASFTYDNLVDPNSPDSFVDSTGGLLWSMSGLLGDSNEVNLWYNPTAEWGAPSDSYSFWGGAAGGYSLESYGTATLTPVPFSSFAPAAAADGGWTLVLLGGALAGLEAARRNLLC